MPPKLGTWQSTFDEVQIGVVMSAGTRRERGFKQIRGRAFWVSQ